MTASTRIEVSELPAGAQAWAHRMTTWGEWSSDNADTPHMVAEAEYSLRSFGHWHTEHAGDVVTLGVRRDL